MKKSHTYPESLREYSRNELKLQINEHLHTIETYREKDQLRTELFAELGSPTSSDIVKVEDWKAIFCRTFSRVINYILERDKESTRKDEILRLKSYAGFYYFIKWFSRALFFLVFSTLGSIAGKEIGCLIEDSSGCDTKAVDLIDSSPHLIASISGLLFALLIGQWLCRIIWDFFTESITNGLRYIEKLAGNSKVLLIIISLLIYLIISGLFAVIFFFFVNIGEEPNIIGAVVGAVIGFVLAVLAYHKSSSCQQPENTPYNRGTNGDNEERNRPPLLVL